MNGCLALVLHAHLPFVRHPEHERSLEETWLFEAITETYLPLLRLFEAWRDDQLPARLTLTLSPTLCAMLRDPLLQGRYLRHVERSIDLAGHEIHRHACQPAFQALARFYHTRWEAARTEFLARRRDLVGSFRILQDQGRMEIITTAATHAFLPLLADHRPSLRGQIFTAVDDYRACFGRDPRGIWLPECGYDPRLEAVLQTTGLRWFVTESHGLLHATPRPRASLYAPILTPGGLAAFARDPLSAEQVWSRHAGYPGDPRYRDFYRDIGFDLDLDYLRPYLPGDGIRTFTGLKYHRITGPAAKEVYDRPEALSAAASHAAHFLQARLDQVRQLGPLLDRPPLLLCPYDAELFGHWWYEGPEFLDAVVRGASGLPLTLLNPAEFLRIEPTLQVAAPAASSWGEHGFGHTWLNEKNHWVQPQLHAAQERMTELARRFPEPPPLPARALRQAARELLLAQASDWLFLLHAGTSPQYATARLQEHLGRFARLYGELTQGAIDAPALEAAEARTPLFAAVDWRHWA